MAKGHLPSNIAKEIGKKHYTKKELAEKEAREVVISEDDIQPPLSLPEELHERFYWYVNEFKGMGILTNVDTEALGRYLIYSQEFWKLREAMKKVGPTSKTYNTISNNLNKVSDRALALEKELGLTMAARMKLRKPDKKEEDKPKTKEEFLFGNALRSVK